MRQKYKENKISNKLAGLASSGKLQMCSGNIRAEICAYWKEVAAKREKE